MNFGFAYDIKGAKFDGGTDDATCMNLYSKYFFSSDSDMSFWGTLGYTIPTGDFDDVDGGLNYGFGMLHNNGIGFYFIINDLEYSETIYNDYNNSYELEADVKITRIGLSWTFKDKEE